MTGRTRLAGLGLAVAGLIAGDLATGTAMAQDNQVIRLGDGAMTCPQIAVEAGGLAQTLGGAPAGGVFGNEQAISAATSVAMQGAIMSGAGRAIPGMGLLGNAIGAAARRDRERREAQAVVQRQRWYYLNGLYAGRACDQAPAPAAAAVETPMEAMPPAPAEAAPATP